MEEVKGAFNILTGNPTENRTVGRSMRKQAENIGIYVKGMGSNRRNQIDQDQNRDY